MQLTRYDRERLGSLLGAAALAGHALPVLQWAHSVLSLPMEAGGLFLGPLIGFPLGIAGLLLLLGAGMLASGHRWPMAIAALAIVTFGDLMALFSGFRSPWLLAGTAVSGMALASYASLVRIDTGGADRGEVVVKVAAMLLGGFILVLVVPRLP